MKKKIVVMMCCLTLLAGMIVVGCGDTADTSDSNTAAQDTADDTKQSEQTTEKNPAENGTMVYGQITAIDEESITIALAEQPEMGDRTGAPEGKEEMPEGSEEMPSTEMGERPEMPEGEEDMPNGGGRNLTLTGEEQTLTVSDSTTITVNGETATIADLSVDDVINVTMDGDNAVSISSGMGGGRMNQGDMMRDTEVTEM